jgi:predicted outer membrane protein
MRVRRFAVAACAIVALGSGSVLIACGDDDSSSDPVGGEDASIAGRSGGSGGRGGGGAGRASSAGSGGSAGAPSIAGTGGNTTPRAGEGGASAGPSSAAGGAGGSTSPEGTLTDAQIAAVTSTANQGEIELGNLATTRAIRPAVREYAQMMVTMHTAAQTRQSELIVTLGVVPTDNAVSLTLRQDTQAIATRLAQASPDAFDLAYAESQAQLHGRVLEIIDDVLLPSVSAASLRAELMVTREEVSRHFTQAMALVETVRNFGSGSDAGTDDAGL